MEIKVYRNKRNENKYLDVKKTKCSHFYIRQYMYWKENGVQNFIGNKKGYFIRTTKSRHLNDLLEDYVLIGKYAYKGGD